jgi:hypothetical protein
MAQLCEVLSKFVLPTSKLLTYLDPTGVEICLKSGYSAETLVETGCGSTNGSVEFLLDFTVPVEISTINNDTFNIFKAYEFELIGINQKRVTTTTGHFFLLIYSEGWIMVDSYIGCRSFSCKYINLPEFMADLGSLNNRFSNELWMKITGCTDHDQNTFAIVPIITQYNRNINGDNIKSKFRTLVWKVNSELDLRSKRNLNSDSYLSLLTPDLNIQTAHEYLKSLISM